MKDLKRTAVIFDKCIRLDEPGREAFLGELNDIALVRRLRRLLEADAAAEREGFLAPLPH